MMARAAEVRWSGLPSSAEQLSERRRQIGGGRFSLLCCPEVQSLRQCIERFVDVNFR